MIAIYFNPDKLTDQAHIQWWANYVAKAEAATDDLLAEWEKWFDCWEKDPCVNKFSYDFKEQIWRDLKLWLEKNVFHGKCAYCETLLDGGDAEHFRPKSRVMTKKDRERCECVVVCFGNGRDLNHPGYFWLAYDWRNIVPACNACNSRAKKDQFPTVVEGVLMVRMSPEELDSYEDPLLLNPLNPSEGRNPVSHLKFGTTGCVVALDSSNLGKHSIDVFKLNRDVLRKRRRSSLRDLKLLFLFARQSPNSRYAKYLEYREISYRLGKEEYSASALDYLKVLKKRYP